MTKNNDNAITCRGVDVTELVRAMFELALSARDPAYDDEGLEGLLLVANLAGFDVPDDFRLAAEPVEPKRPEPPRQQYLSGGALLTRSTEELNEANRLHDEERSAWRARQAALVERTRAELVSRVGARAAEMVAAAGERAR